MNKLLWFLVLLPLVWLFQLSLDVERIQRQQVNQLNANIDQQKQRIDRLNDQYAALNSLLNKRAVMSPATEIKKLEDISSSAEFSQQQSLYDRLQLIQLTIQQRGHSTALAQIQAVKLYIAQNQPLSTSLNTGLLTALEIDQKNLLNFVHHESTQQALLLQQLQAIEREIQPHKLDSVAKKRRWFEWFRLSQVDQELDLKNKALHYQHIKLQLLLAQQALLAGHVVFYKTIIKQIATDLGRYPDDVSKNIAQNLNKLAEINLMSQPKLTAITLMQGQ